MKNQKNSICLEKTLKDAMAARPEVFERAIQEAQEFPPEPMSLGWLPTGKWEAPDPNSVTIAVR